MAYVVQRRSGGWELRSSQATPAGPRSRTLASFRVLTDEVIERALERAGGELDAEGIRAAARRAGAPVARQPAIAAAARLLGELSRGSSLPLGWSRLLAGVLGADGEPPTDGERAAAAWADATPEQRGRALRDLLLLADRIGAPRRAARPRFPRLVSASE